ncbi:hypothetical protein [Pseudarthrobacter sp. PH31-O2]|uniref:hypothetical protein n=1 Tax=Pseudarthrobacter sp. PH31-O2 TaxID=3046206 RepID=UPI0024B89A46|nr:hypothetical protein [Pseudarthrobacter sp. PH31-O2]MDJ0354467.1 hypothetical protein [Pseudarthrobacter sp. PH31-O2]
MNVLAFPATDLALSLADRAVPATVRVLPDRTAVNEADRPLHEMLHKAVVAYRAGEDRAPGPPGHRHHRLAHRRRAFPPACSGVRRLHDR